jgi:hypothetical protein
MVSVERFSSIFILIQNSILCTRLEVLYDQYIIIFRKIVRNTTMTIVIIKIVDKIYIKACLNKIETILPIVSIFIKDDLMENLLF